MQLAHQELAARLTVEAVSLVIIMVIVSLVIIMVMVNLVMIMVMVNMRIIKVIHHGDRQHHGYGDGQDCDHDGNNSVVLITMILTSLTDWSCRREDAGRRTWI